MTQAIVNQAMMDMAQIPPEGHIEGHIEAPPANMSIPQWYLLERTAIEAQMRNIDYQLTEMVNFFTHAAMLRRSAMQNRMNFLNHTYGADFQKQVSEDCKNVGKKSMTYLSGKAGFRKKPDTLEIVDEDRAVTDAELNMPNAVKRSILKREVLAAWKKTGEVLSGCKVTKGQDTFFPCVEQIELSPGSGPEPRARAFADDANQRQAAIAPRVDTMA